MKKFPLLLAMIFSLITLQGCASKSFHVEIDSIAQQNLPSESGKKYCILSGSEQRDKNDLYFLEVVDQIKPYLEEKGMTLIADTLNADNVIFLDFGISDPIQKTKSYLVPQRGIVGYNTYSHGNSNYNIAGNHIYGQGSSNSHTTAQYGIVGYRTEQHHYTEYIRWIKMTTYRLVGNPPELGPQLWRLVLQSKGSTNDFREVLPFIIAPLSETLGTNTRGRAKFRVDDDEVAVSLGLTDKRISVRRID